MERHELLGGPSSLVFQLVFTKGWSTQFEETLRPNAAKRWALAKGHKCLLCVPNDLPSASDNCAHLNQQNGKQPEL